MNDELLSFEAQLQRLKKASNVASDTELAKVLEISQGGVSSAKQRKKLPAEWVKLIALKTGVDANWLFFGEGTMMKDKAIESMEIQAPADLEFTQRMGRSDRFSIESLFEQNSDLMQENKELVKENRELNKENRQLMKENGDLRVELAEIKARAAPDQEVHNEAHRKAG